MSDNGYTKRIFLNENSNNNSINGSHNNSGYMRGF